MSKGKITDKVKKSWDDVPETIKNTFEKLGIPEAEQKYLAGVSTQFESEVVYHNTIEELEKYNDLKEINIGTKLIIPILKEKDNDK